jgi:NADP-dependent 3-hydroxy acid dehydrogenase YdfG
MDSKVVVITGASSGIGASLARQLGGKGDRLVLGARRETLLRQVAAEAGSGAIPVVTDVTRRGDVEHLRDVALEKFGHVDVWVNNAGRGSSHGVMDLTDEDVQGILDVVLKSVLYGTQAIIPHFQERGTGHLINVSSFMGRVPLATYRSIYSAAKSAVNILTANLRMDLRAKYPGIRVSLVMPGIVDTEFHKVAQTPIPIRAGERAGTTLVETANEVAAKIASLIEQPVAELYTAPQMADLTRQYYQDVGAFEERMASRH